MLRTASAALVVVLGAAITAPFSTAAEKLALDDLAAWQASTGDWAAVGKVALDSADAKRLTVEPGSGVLYNGPKGRTVDILSKAEYGDVEVHVEFMVPKGSNSGVYLQGRYEVQILDSFGVAKPGPGDCGGIYQRWADNKGFEGRAPNVNASLAPGQWQSFDIVFRAPRFDAQGKKTASARFVKVVHNGKLVHENVAVGGPTRAARFNDERPTGPLMIQGDHGPVAIRNITLKPLDP